ncbi:MAG: hypothetical protein NFW16_14860 [Candidatus Accumulibacter sp.]|uniref:hypothetical protein n=1 Tax=Accumulibacter sp. TaxID=2053492 RepID=UPI002586DD4D|nr:hypothetical protein [Accumulibacter sp.]MCM8622972.1 hypothetical protein [Accumulibacter sp.]
MQTCRPFSTTPFSSSSERPDADLPEIADARRATDLSGDRPAGDAGHERKRRASVDVQASVQYRSAGTPTGDEALARSIPHSSMLCIGSCSHARYTVRGHD